MERIRLCMNETSFDPLAGPASRRIQVLAVFFRS